MQSVIPADPPKSAGRLTHARCVQCLDTAGGSSEAKTSVALCCASSEWDAHLEQHRRPFRKHLRILAEAHESRIISVAKGGVWIEPIRTLSTPRPQSPRTASTLHTAHRFSTPSQRNTATYSTAAQSRTRTAPLVRYTARLSCTPDASLINIRTCCLTNNAKGLTAQVQVSEQRGHQADEVPTPRECCASSHEHQNVHPRAQRKRARVLMPTRESLTSASMPRSRKRRQVSLAAWMYGLPYSAISM